MPSEARHQWSELAKQIASNSRRLFGSLAKNRLVRWRSCESSRERFLGGSSEPVIPSPRSAAGASFLRWGFLAVCAARNDKATGRIGMTEYRPSYESSSRDCQRSPQERIARVA